MTEQDRLTYEDVEILMEALSALESKANSEGMTGMLLGAMMAKSEEDRNEVFEKHKAEMHNQEQKALAERCIMLKAKLLQIRDRIEVEGLR